MSAQSMTMENGISTGRVIPEEAPDLAGRIERAKSRLMEKEAKFEGYVKEHPVRSVLVAAGIGAGVGLLFGVLLSRR